MQTSEYCKLKHIGYETYLYFCDESGNNVANPRRCFDLKTALAELKYNGWEIMQMKWHDRGRVTYTLYRSSTNLA
jgi:hypothetical protein